MTGTGCGTAAAAAHCSGEALLPRFLCAGRRSLSVAAAASSSSQGCSHDSSSQQDQQPALARRQLLSAALLAPAAAALMPAAAAWADEGGSAAGFTYTDDQDLFSITVPGGWVQGSGAIGQEGTLTSNQVGCGWACLQGTPQAWSCAYGWAMPAQI